MAPFTNNLQTLNLQQQSKGIQVTLKRNNTQLGEKIYSLSSKDLWLHITFILSSFKAARTSSAAPHKISRGWAKQKIKNIV